VVDLPGSKITCAMWGGLNKLVFAGHENGEVATWDWQVATLARGRAPGARARLPRLGG
jgi:hypothetical protein